MTALLRAHHVRAAEESDDINLRKLERRRQRTGSEERETRKKNSAHERIVDSARRSSTEMCLQLHPRAVLFGGLQTGHHDLLGL